MATIVDPFRVPGRWLVTTRSGARYLAESTFEPLRAVTVTRFRVSGSRGGAGYALRRLRRDGESLRVGSIRHIDDGSACDAIRVGQDMHLVLEPLARDAMLTVRRTTPVVSIEPLRDTHGPLTT